MASECSSCQVVWMGEVEEGVCKLFPLSGVLSVSFLETPGSFLGYSLMILILYLPCFCDLSSQVFSLRSLITTSEFSCHGPIHFSYFSLIQLFIHSTSKRFFFLCQTKRSDQIAFTAMHGCTSSSAVIPSSCKCEGLSTGS